MIMITKDCGHNTNVHSKDYKRNSYEILSNTRRYTPITRTKIIIYFYKF